jgi:hypothetical protein
MGRHCAWGECSSDSRKEDPDVTFVPFPKPASFLDKAKRWAILCGRGNDFKVTNITRFSTICSMHFTHGTNLDIKENHSLEPFNALWSAQKLRKALNPRQPRARDDVGKPEEEATFVTYSASRRLGFPVSFAAVPKIPLSTEVTDPGIHYLKIRVRKKRGWGGWR